MTKKPYIMCAYIKAGISSVSRPDKKYIQAST